MGKTVIGLDIGTSAIKTVAYSLENGVLLSERTEIPARISDGKTINPEELARIVIGLLSKTVKSAKHGASAVCLSTIFPTLLALDSKGRPLTKILTWMDNSAAPIVASFKQRTKSPGIHRKTGCVVHESYPLWKILLLKKNSPEVFSKTEKFVSLSEYLTYKLTGKFIISNSIASTTSMFNTKTLDWDDSILDMAGISREKLSEPCSVFHQEKIINGILSKTGLRNNACLVLGAGDGLLSHLGTGCAKDKIMSSTLGTSGALRLSSPRLVTGNTRLWHYNLDDKTWVSGSAINSGWSTLKWFETNVKNFRFSDAKLKNRDFKGPVFLPFINGERGPGYNQNMRAALIGINQKLKLEELYSSVAEGILFNLYSCYELITEELGEPLQIRASGGYTTADNMLQMQADIFNKEIIITNALEASAVGASILALKSLDEISSITEISPRIKKTFKPDKEKHKAYMKRYETYEKAYSIMSKN